MFDIAIKHVDDRAARQIFKVLCDTLSEAEHFLIGVLQVQFDSRSIVLIYNDDLVYHVYDDSGFLGVVQINLDG